MMRNIQGNIDLIISTVERLCYSDAKFQSSPPAKTLLPGSSTQLRSPLIHPTRPCQRKNERNKPNGGLNTRGRYEPRVAKPAQTSYAQSGSQKYFGNTTGIILPDVFLPGLEWQSMFL